MARICAATGKYPPRCHRRTCLACFPEVFEAGHRRARVKVGSRRWALPLRHSADAPYSSVLRMSEMPQGVKRGRIVMVRGSCLRHGVRGSCLRHGDRDVSLLPVPQGLGDRFKRGGRGTVGSDRWLCSAVPRRDAHPEYKSIALTVCPVRRVATGCIGLQPRRPDGPRRPLQRRLAAINRRRRPVPRMPSPSCRS
jgi:hypothetical protein